MTKHDAENERIKRKYFVYMKEAKQHSEPAVDAAAKALSRFEEYNQYHNFKHSTISRRLHTGQTHLNCLCGTEGKQMR